MRPAQAYIASFSTTGVLVVLAVLLLLVVGALMAFDGSGERDGSPAVPDVAVGESDAAGALTASARTADSAPRAERARPAEPPSTEGVVLVPEPVPPPVAFVEEPMGPRGDELATGTGPEAAAPPPSEPAPAAEDEPVVGEELAADVEDLVVGVSPEAGEALDTLLEEVVEALPEERRGVPVTSAD